MPLVLELAFVPLVGLLVVSQAAEIHAEFAPVRKIVDWVLVVAGACLASYILVSAITDLHALLTREKGEALLLAPILTLAFAPFLYVITKWSRWDLRRVERLWRQRKGRILGLSSARWPVG